MPVLCFDISSGGISAAIVQPNLTIGKVAEREWRLQVDESGSATLNLEGIVSVFQELSASLAAASPIDAVSIACFMHSMVVLGDDEQALTPVFTWLDRHGEAGVELIRSRMGSRFHQRTGCRLHPMFPVFKLAALYGSNDARLSAVRRVVSVKSVILRKLTGVWVEDHGMASASGLFNIVENRWDSEILELTGLDAGNLVPVAARDEVIGYVTNAAAAGFGIAAGTPVVNGSGDGLLANTGTGCDSPKRIAVTIGTSASARQSLSLAVLNESAGTFCYKAAMDLSVLGCASNNGGNVLDWARSVLGGLDSSSESLMDVPIFIPLLHGERSPEWNAHLTGSWHGLTSLHGPAHLRQSVIEGVVFNLASFVEILERTSGIHAEEIILSGNGFLNRMAVSTLASLLSAETLFMADPGLASLRGAAVCALRASGYDPGVDIERLVGEAAVIPSADDPALRARFQRYKELRGKAC